MDLLLRVFVVLLLLSAPARAGEPDSSEPTSEEASESTEASADAPQEEPAKAVDPELVAKRAELAAALDAFTIEDTGHAFLWKVTSKKKKHKGVAWVTGSIHLGKADMYPLDGAITEAFAEADALCVEADIAAPGKEKEMASKLMEMAMLPEGETISTLLPHRAEEIKNTLAAYMVPMAIADRMKPFMVSMMVSLLEMKWAGWDESLGIDRHFLDAARGNKEIVELESVEMQAELLGTMPMDIQLAMLESSLDFHGLAAKWTPLAWQAIAQGSADAVVQLGEMEGGDPDDPKLEEFNQLLLDKRNVGMADLIVEHVTKGKGTWFVVVGALHVPGENGVLDLLDDRRFLRIEQQKRATP